MDPRMSSAEKELFAAFVRHSDKYAEFGTGGSTVWASSYVQSWVLSVDSSQAWLDKVAEACSTKRTQPNLIHVDIGPVGDWGYPTDTLTADRWPRYHNDVWNDPRSHEADLYFVDGRFRVACFAQIVLHCQQRAIIGFHDYMSRPHYHAIAEIARPIASAEDLTFFRPEISKRDRAMDLLKTHCRTPQ